MPDSNKKICILYDFLYCMGGAEKTSLNLHEAFPESELCVDFINRENFTDISLPSSIIELGKPSTCQPFNAIKGFYNFKSKTKFLKNYDMVIYSGSYALLAVHNQKKGYRILYCHTLPRFAYDLYEYYLENLNVAFRPAFKALVYHTRKNYEAAFKKMDLIIANSQNVRNRIQRYLGVNALVIHPPVDVKKFKWLGQEDYYLSTARLEKYKRVDLIIDAFKKMPSKKLVVTSGGSELENLKTLSNNAPNINFTGWTNEDKLKDLIGKAIATIYLPKDEDFGISPVESMAAGKPTIGAQEGGILETILDKKTGLLIKPKSVEIINAVISLDSSKALSMKRDCEKRAQKFKTDDFVSKIRKVCI
ncbi:glycosyltransferase [Desulfovibrio gilichinskyi]|uniref:Glycosyltransferase involved in cell wall bisynthesis n=1 Tax=Desulfovibrio gilichinskyi TaxID=1519643 RepID=A0A1X7EJ06_9BACT|nr:glycosyltransferase [Desulfovibrio gilichinskyi]SMF34680.1 Glycosyltransferase involved in cell wall bisynthesis [Desulfovibrio gilichinskyi]